MHFSLKSLAAAAVLFSVAAAPAMALPTIPGNSSFQVGGSLRGAPDSNTFIDASGFDFGTQNADGTFTYGTPGGDVQLGGNGSQFFRDMGFIAGVNGTAVDIATGSFDGVGTNGPTKAVPITSLYSFTVNGSTLSFDLATLTDVKRDTSVDTGNQTVTINGRGTVHLTGYEDSMATFSLAATRTGTGLAATFSSSVTTGVTDVPEPISLAILGTGLVAMGVIRRKQSN